MPATRSSRPRSAAPPMPVSRPGTRCSARSGARACRSWTSKPGVRAAGPRSMLAGAAIRAGQYDCALVFGIEKMPRGIIRSSFFEPWREEAGLAATPAYFALRAQRLMRESGVTKDQLAEVVVKNRGNGVHNPNAMFRSKVTAEQVLASRVVCEPLHLWMLCSPNEGAAAVVLRAAPAAGAGSSITLEAAALRSHLPGSVLSEGTPLSGLTDDDVEPPTTLAARAAYEEAGVAPDDIDVFECQDTDAAPRVAVVRGARPLSRGRRREMDHRRCDPPRRPRPGEPERRPLVEGRATGRVSARPGRRARDAAARRGGTAPGRRITRRARPHGRARRQRVGRRRAELAQRPRLRRPPD